MKGEDGADNGQSIKVIGKKKEITANALAKQHEAENNDTTNFI